jgi:hypothetical protein
MGSTNCSSASTLSISGSTFVTATKWQEACQRCKGLVEPKDVATILSTPTYQHLKTEVEKMEQTYKGRKSAKILERMAPFLEKIRSFSGVVDTAIQANPEVAALVWGGLKLTLEVCGHVGRCPFRRGMAGW